MRQAESSPGDEALLYCSWFQAQSDRKPEFQASSVTPQANYLNPALLFPSAGVLIRKAMVFEKLRCFVLTMKVLRTTSDVSGLRANHSKGIKETNGSLVGPRVSHLCNILSVQIKSLRQPWLVLCTPPESQGEY